MEHIIFNESLHRNELILSQQKFWKIWELDIWVNRSLTWSVAFKTILDHHFQILHIAGQIDVMCHELLEISVAEDKQDSRMLALKSVVNRHQRIIAFADNIEDVFCYMALIQFLSNTIVICFLGFVIVTVSNPIRSPRAKFCDLFEGPVSES